MQIPVNYLAVVVAAVAGYVLSWGWYALFSAIWMKGLDKRKKDMKPEPMPFILAAVAYLLMAWMLAGLMGHLADVTIRGGVMAAFFVWIGFVLTTTAVTQAFQGRHPSVTVIDVGNWLAVLIVMGAVIGAFGV
jgi:beta-lactamase superfamily II metal-dependent hydrolase